MQNIDDLEIVFLETARFDDNEKQWGMTGGFSFLTDITTVKSGREKRNAVYTIPKGTWEIGNRGVRDKEYEMIQSFHFGVLGRLIGFRFRDWIDYKETGKNGVAKKLDNTSLNYQMYKRRVIESANVYRLQKIVKPIGPSFASTPGLGNTIKFYWNDTEIIQSDNTSDPFTITLNDKKGQFSYNPSTLVVDVDSTGVYTSHTPHNLKINDGIRFTRGTDTIYTYITEIISTTQFKVNYSVLFTATDLNTNPYPTDVSNFYWRGEYDKPVRFDTDSFIPTIELFKTENGETRTALQLPTIPLVELTSEEDYLNKEDR